MLLPHDPPPLPSPPTVYTRMPAQREEQRRGDDMVQEVPTTVGTTAAAAAAAESTALRCRRSALTRQREKLDYSMHLPPLVGPWW